MASLILKLIVRSWRIHWLRTLSLMLVIAMGTSVYLAVDAGNRVALQSFSEFSNRVGGEGTYTIQARHGKLNFEDLKKIQVAVRDYEVFLIPRAEMLAVLNQEGDDKLSRQYFNIYGLDLLSLASYWSENGLLQFEDQSIDSSPLFQFLEEENAFLTRDVGLSSKQGSLQFSVGNQMVSLEKDQSLSVFLPNFLPETLLLMEHEQLMKLLGREAYWDAVDIVKTDLPAADLSALLEKVRAISQKSDWSLSSPEDRSLAGEQLTESFRYNLKALSLLSLLVTVMIVFQAMDVAVTKRTREISILYSLGLSPFAMRVTLYAEVLVLGLIGSVLGVWIGLYLAGISAGVVNKTVSVLYYFSNSEIEVSTDLVVQSIFFGLLISLVGSSIPVIAAGKVPNVQSLKSGAHSRPLQVKYYKRWIGLLWIAAYLAIQVPSLPMSNGHSLPLGAYVSCLLLILGFALLSIASLAKLGSWLSQLANSSTVLFLGVSQLRRPLSRHALAMTSIVLSISMTVSILVLIASFEDTVKKWLDSVLIADVFVRPKTVTHYSQDVHLSQQQVQEIYTDSSIKFAGSIFSQTVLVEGEKEKLVGYDVDYLIRANQLSWIERPESLNLLKNTYTTIISEPFASRKNLNTGDFINIETSEQAMRFEIIGIYREFGNEKGTFGIALTHYATLINRSELLPDALAIHLKEKESIDLWVRDMQQKYPALDIIAQSRLRAESLAIFRNVFSVTYALQLIGIIVACGGLASMIFSLIMERTGEIFTLKRIGIANAQIRKIFQIESAFLSFVGAFYGSLLGLLMGCILVLVINKEAFGWTLNLVLPHASIALVALFLILSGQLTVFFISRWIYKIKLKNEE